MDYARSPWWADAQSLGEMRVHLDSRTSAQPASARIASQQTHSNGLHQLNAVGNVPFNVELNAVDPAQIIGDEILRRHRLLNSFHKLKKTSRAAASVPAIFFSMVKFHGKRKEHFSGLYVEDKPDEIADSVGLNRSIGYVAVRDLEEAGLLRRVWKRQGCDYEILMPDEPGQFPNPRLKNNDLQSTTPDDPFFAPTHTPSTTPDARALPDEKARALPDISGGARAVQGFPGGLSTDSNVNVNALQSADAAEGGGGEEAGGGAQELRVELLLAQGKTPDEKFDVGAAIALARNPNATIERIRWIIARCDHVQSQNKLRGKRQAYITRGIQQAWQPPPTPQEKGLADKERAIKKEQRAQREMPAQMPLEIMRQKLLTLGPEKVKELIERVIASEPDDSFFKAQFRRCKDSALQRLVFTLRIFNLAIGDGLIPDEQQVMHGMAVGGGDFQNFCCCDAAAAAGNRAGGGPELVQSTLTPDSSGKEMLP
jgi:hypothetical protein